MATTPPNEARDLSFEDTLKRLEEITHALEEGKSGLDDALAHYEEGIGLLRRSYTLLEKAERRIELLTGIDSEGNPVTRPLADVSTFAADQDASSSGKGTAPTASPKARRTRRTTEETDE